MRVLCFTNLDSYRAEKWPSLMVAMPNKGDYVRSEQGKRLKIVSITHYMSQQGNESQAMLEIELHN